MCDETPVPPANDTPPVAHPCPAELTTKDGSPGLIADEEHLVWVIFDPDNISDWQLVGTKFSKKRLKEGSFSVVRKQHTTTQEITAKVVTPKTRDGIQHFIGLAIAVTNDIREIKDTRTNDRLVCAYDDPEHGFPSHALLHYSTHTKGGYWEKNKNAQTAVVGNLMAAFRKHGGPHTLEALFPT